MSSNSRENTMRYLLYNLYFARLRTPWNASRFVPASFAEHLFEAVLLKTVCLCTGVACLIGMELLQTQDIMCFECQSDGYVLQDLVVFNRWVPD